MRRLFIFIFIAILGFAPFAGFSVSGQEEEDIAWNGVSLVDANVDPAPLEEFLVGVPLGTLRDSQQRSIGQRVPTGFQFDFLYDPNQQTYRPQVPEIEDAEGRKVAEFMVVIVASGEFVLTVLPSSPAFVVDPPQDQTISYMDVTGNWADSPDPGFEYTELENDLVLDENGQPCTNLCTVLNPSSDPDPTAENVVAVLLPEGSRVQADAGNFCLWCLIHGQEGSLLVYPFTQNDGEFSWESSLSASQAASPGGVEFVKADSTSSDTTPVRMAWAFYDPASGCN